MAALDFGANALALRCQSSVVEFIMTGAPAATTEWQKMDVKVGSHDVERQTWTTQAGMTYLFASDPERLARQLRSGGVLDLRLVPTDETDRARRYQFPVPASTEAVDQVLQACGRPLTDERDSLPRLAVDVTWANRPTPYYPDNDSALAARAGRVVLNCIIGDDMHVRDCRVESEEPAHAGFAASAIRSAEAAQIDPKGDPASVRGRVIRFPITFRLP